MARRKKLFRKLNPPPGTTPLLVGALALAAVGGGIYLYSEPAKTKKKKSGCKPYKYKEAPVRQAIELQIANGERDPLKIAVDVATEFFGVHPDGGQVVFPPEVGNAKKGVACVWGKVVALVALIFDEQGIDPDADENQAVDIVIHDPYDPGYPWEEASLEKANYPTPGMFADVGGSHDAFSYSKGPMAVINAALNSAIAMAAAKGIDVSVAQDIMAQDANDSAKKRDLLKQMVIETFCSGYNDGLYGREVPKADKNSAKNLYGWVPTGRSPLYLPQHNDILAQMSLGEVLRRAITKNGTHKKGEGRRQPVLWMPAINLEKLGGPSPVVTTAGMKWSDGTSTREPPPVVQRLGINPNGVSLPGGPGCR